MRSQIIVLQGRNIRVWTGGDGPPLLLLHSAWGDAETNWSLSWEDLSGSFRVIAPDLPGFGASEPLPAPSLAGFAVILRELLKELDTGPVAVLGNSFGSAVAIEFAAAFPDNVKRLLPMNGTNLPFIPGLLKKIIALPVLKRRFQAAMHKATYSDGAFARAFPDQALLPAGFLDRVRACEEKNAPIVFDVFMNQSEPQRKPRVPAAVIWGIADRLTGPRMAAALKKWLGEPLFIPIEGAGHLPQIERPGAFVEAVRTALGEEERS